jgi:predicted nucleic acid-binding protein
VIIADTGLWLAVANRRDRHHAAAVAALRDVREPLITTWPVMTETCHLLVTRLGTKASVSFVRAAEQGALEIFALAASHLGRIAGLMEQYHELPMDLADASLVVLAEEIGSGRILSTDQRDFGIHRWKNHKPFRNLLVLER